MSAAVAGGRCGVCCPLALRRVLPSRARMEDASQHKGPHPTPLYTRPYGLIITRKVGARLICFSEGVKDWDQWSVIYFRGWEGLGTLGHPLCRLLAVEKV